LAEDQVERLRRIRDAERKRGGESGSRRVGSARRLSVTSGKGGVGKSSFALNTAIILSSMNKKVLLIDADTNLANIDIMLGVAPRYNLSDVITGGKFMQEIITSGPGGIDILPGASGDVEMVELEAEVQRRLVDSFSSLEQEYDFVIIDTGAGLTTSVVNYVTSSDEVVIVTNPEPTAISDAYTMIKVISTYNPVLRVRLLVNGVKSRDQAISVYDRLNLVAQNFINRSIEYLGHLPMDVSVAAAVSRRSPFVLEFPKCNASRALRLTTRKLLTGRTTKTSENGSLFSKFFRMKSDRI